MYAMNRLCGRGVALLLSAVPRGSVAQGNDPVNTKVRIVMKFATATLNNG